MGECRGGCPVSRAAHPGPPSAGGTAPALGRVGDRHAGRAVRARAAGGDGCARPCPADAGNRGCDSARPDPAAGAGRRFGRAARAGGRPASVQLRGCVRCGRLVDRVRPGRARARPRASRRSRARRRGRIPHPQRAHAAGAGRARSRSGHGMRDPGHARLPSRQARGGDRHLGARARTGRAQRRAQRDRERRVPPGQPVRAGRRGDVRPHRVEPAVRHHAARRRRSRIRVPGRRDGRRRTRRGGHPVGAENT